MVFTHQFLFLYWDHIPYGFLYGGLEVGTPSLTESGKALGEKESQYLSFRMLNVTY